MIINNFSKSILQTKIFYFAVRYLVLSIQFLLQLYEINDDPKRKEFLDDLFSFMQKRGKYSKIFAFLAQRYR